MEILPFGTGGLVGNALRLSKGGPAGEPRLDWSLAGLDPATRYAILRDEDWPPDSLAVAPGAGHAPSSSIHGSGAHDISSTRTEVTSAAFFRGFDGGSAG